MVGMMMVTAMVTVAHMMILMVVMVMARAGRS